MFMNMLIYQLLLRIPGINPSLASSLKHILHNAKSLIYPLFLPHLKHRRTILLLNFGGFKDLAYVDVLDIFL